MLLPGGGTGDPLLQLCQELKGSGAEVSIICSLLHFDSHLVDSVNLKGLVLRCALYPLPSYFDFDCEIL